MQLTSRKKFWKQNGIGNKPDNNKLWGNFMAAKPVKAGPEPADNGILSTPARVNIEALMLMAKYDEAFRELLLSDRAKALERSGITFSQSEKLMLSILPSDKLKSSIEEFTISGVNRESLSSWKEAASVIMLVMSVIIGGACAGTQPDPSWILHGKHTTGNCSIAELKEGWCDKNTYRIFAKAEANKKIKDIGKRKESARWGAVLNAQYLILEKFKGARIEGTGISVFIDPKEIAAGKELIGYVKNGTVIAEKYDEEQTCEIVYEVHGTDLKKKTAYAVFN